jgi:hypothetical protein
MDLLIIMESKIQIVDRTINTLYERTVARFKIYGTFLDGDMKKIFCFLDTWFLVFGSWIKKSIYN